MTRSIERLPGAYVLEHVGVESPTTSSGLEVRLVPAAAVPTPADGEPRSSPSQPSTAARSVAFGRQGEGDR